MNGGAKYLRGCSDSRVCVCLAHSLHPHTRDRAPEQCVFHAYAFMLLSALNVELANPNSDLATETIAANSTAANNTGSTQES